MVLLDFFLKDCKQNLFARILFNKSVVNIFFEGEVYFEKDLALKVKSKALKTKSSQRSFVGKHFVDRKAKLLFFGSRFVTPFERRPVFKLFRR